MKRYINFTLNGTHSLFLAEDQTIRFIPGDIANVFERLKFVAEHLGPHKFNHDLDAFEYVGNFPAIDFNERTAKEEG